MTAIKPRTATVTIYQGDDLAKLAELEAAAQKAEGALAVARQAVDIARRASEKASAGLLSDDSPESERMAKAVEDLQVAQEAFDAAAVEHDDFAAEAQGRGVTVVLHALRRLRWRELMNTHPARIGDDGKVLPADDLFGVNMETLPDVLLPESVDRDASTIEGDVGEFLESLSDFDYYDRLFVEAFTLNRGSVRADPTLRLLSGGSRI